MTMNFAPERGRRRLMRTLLALPLLSACALTQPVEALTLRHKFRGVYGSLVVLDAMDKLHNFEITTDSGRYIAAPALLSLRNRLHLDFIDDRLPVPRFVHFTWREGPVKIGRPLNPDGSRGSRQWIGGTIVGDYTIPVAERIPDEVLNEIRANGGLLRLKFRVHDHGVMLGWDIERRPGYTPGAMFNPNEPNIPHHFPAVHHLAGGDFREARIFDGKPVRKGWYIDADGQRIETDF